MPVDSKARGKFPQISERTKAVQSEGLSFRCAKMYHTGALPEKALLKADASDLVQLQAQHRYGSHRVVTKPRPLKYHS